MRRLPALIPLLVWLAACGGDDATFTAEEFVAAVNQRGASLELGPELRSTRADVEVFAVALTSAGRGGAEEHGGGSLVVMPDAEAGAEEWERCDQAASLLCFRADNIAVLLEGDVGRRQEAALNAALQSIGEDTSD